MRIYCKRSHINDDGGVVLVQADKLQHAMLELRMQGMRRSILWQEDLAPTNAPKILLETGGDL